MCVCVCVCACARVFALALAVMLRREKAWLAPRQTKVGDRCCSISRCLHPTSAPTSAAVQGGRSRTASDASRLRATVRKQRSGGNGA